MEFKKLVFICISIMFTNSCFAYEFKRASENTLFKNYALSMCIATNYESESIYKDAIDSLNGNREYGNIALEAYHELNEVQKMWQKIKYKSKKGNVSELFMCIDFHNSKDVQNIFNRYNPCKDKANWNSDDEFKMRCK